MPKRAKELSALAVSKLRRDGFHPVGEVPGLGLHISGESRSWLLRFSFEGRRPEMGLGRFPEVPLALARQKAREARELIRQLINPIDAKQTARRAAAAARAASKSAQALQFAILTAARSGEVRGATWQEIDFAAKAWTVPAKRTKTKKPHRVPLAEPALRLLRTRPEGTGSELIFASSRNGQQLSDTAMLATMRSMQVAAVPQGLARATFKTWATGCTSLPREVVEMALGHTLENKTEEAYWRGALFEKRIRAMRAWAEFLNQPVRTASVTPIRK